jgi:hypothetical protein
VTRHLWWFLGGLVLAASACSSSSNCSGAPILFVELPAGTDSVSSFSATGACALEIGGCAPVSANCSTSGCDCKFTVQVNATTFGRMPNGDCHIEAISTAGAVFTRDLTFTSSSSSCFAVSGPSGMTITVDFTNAGVGDAGAGDAEAGDADAGTAESGEDGADVAADIGEAG